MSEDKKIDIEQLITTGKPCFVDCKWPSWERVDGKWTFMGNERGKGLLLGDKIHLANGSYKSLSRSKKLVVTRVYQSVRPTWVTDDLWKMYLEALPEEERNSIPKKYNFAYKEKNSKTPKGDSQVTLTELLTPELDQNASEDIEDPYADVPWPEEEEEYKPGLFESLYDRKDDGQNMRQILESSVSDVTLSDEQELFIKRVMEGNNVLVDACIGSGKTTAIQHLCNRLPSNKKVLYLTYNKLLKLDAKEKIRMRNVKVTNYHGFAWEMVNKMGKKVGVSDTIQAFILAEPPIPHYDVLIIDEYQDIEKEFSLMLRMIKEANPGIQIAAVGDMAQKIYDKTTLNVEKFMNEFLGSHIKLEFTQCFRLSAEHAAYLGRIWKKRIEGVNQSCEIISMSESEVVEFLAEQKVSDVLCLGARNGSLSRTLNDLEEYYPSKYNKNTVYASISDDDSLGTKNPDKNCAIFTTYDSSKGLERKICVIFDFTESYWTTRIRMPQQKYEILRNIFCVAASRGKDKIIFVEPDEALLSEITLSTPVGTNYKPDNMNISEMFDFKYREDIEECFRLIDKKKIEVEDTSVIEVKSNDGLIDISPCIGIYQEACFFNRYDIDSKIMFHLSVGRAGEKKHLYTDAIRSSSLEKKILFSVAMETRQNRYFDQVQTPFITRDEDIRIQKRLSSRLDKDEEGIQKECSIEFANKKGGSLYFSARGQCDVLKDDVVYELKFVSELTHEHFLQCASYMIGFGLKKGILWNTRDNTVWEITIPDRAAFMDAVARTITKGALDGYYDPNELEDFDGGEEEDTKPKLTLESIFKGKKANKHKKKKGKN